MFIYALALLAGHCLVISVCRDCRICTGPGIRAARGDRRYDAVPTTLAGSPRCFAECYGAGVTQYTECRTICRPVRESM